MEFLSLKLGRNHAYMHQFVNKGTPTELRFEDRVKLAQLLQCTVTDLTIDEENTKAAIGGVSTIPTLPFDIPSASIPILGRVTHGKLGPVMSFAVDDPDQGYVRTPPTMFDVPGAYASYVPDDKMEPALREGFLIYLNPIKTVIPGDEVLVRFLDGTAMVRELVERDVDHVTLRQHNPAKNQKFQTAEIECIHLIAMSARTRG